MKIYGNHLPPDAPERLRLSPEEIARLYESPLDSRVRTEIARTVERMVNFAVTHCLPGASNANYEGAWAAAFRATQEQETKK